MATYAVTTSDGELPDDECAYAVETVELPEGTSIVEYLKKAHAVKQAEFRRIDPSGTTVAIHRTHGGNKCRIVAWPIAAETNKPTEREAPDEDLPVFLTGTQIEMFDIEDNHYW